MRSPTRSAASSSSGWCLPLVPFVLSWFLKEVPLRTTIARAAEEAPPEPSGQLAWESPDR